MHIFSKSRDPHALQMLLCGMILFACLASPVLQCRRCDFPATVSGKSSRSSTPDYPLFLSIQRNGKIGIPLFDTFGFFPALPSFHTSRNWHCMLTVRITLFAVLFPQVMLLWRKHFSSGRNRCWTIAYWIKDSLVFVSVVDFAQAKET